MKTIGKLGLALVTVILLSNLLFGGRGDSTEDIQKHLQTGALVIDVRTQGEFKSWHVKDAINIPYDVIATHIAQHEKDKDRAIIVYCRSGSRSSYAKKYLNEAGYANVVDGGGLSNIKKYTDNR